MGDLASQYVAVWRAILIGWLGWNDERFAEWAAKYDAGLTDTEADSLFYHYDELYYVLSLLVPRDLAERLIYIRSQKSYSAFGELLGELGDAIAGRPFMPSWGTPEFDWAAGRDRVEAVRRRWGAKLPTSDP